MLSCFPTPYPEEWWYSVLCRYYVRSGVKQHLPVKRMLFNGNEGAHMGTVFPNKTLVEIVNQLPKDVFNAEDIILNHTPFLYYTRMYQTEDRRRMLEQLLQGDTLQLTHLWKSFQRAVWCPRYCPMCVEEDTNKYGEPYWHTGHQIPLMSVCTKHKCRLEAFEISNGYRMLNQVFYPLSSVPYREPNLEYKEWELAVSKLVKEYWKLPISVGPTEHNNLVQELKNNGYLMIYRHGDVSLNPQKLYEDLKSMYGETLTVQCFGDKIIAGMINRIIRWEQLLPDRYILIQNMIGMDTSAMFSDVPIPDFIKEKIDNLSESGEFYTLKETAKLFGMKEYEVNTLFKHYGVPPVWMPPVKGKYEVARTGVMQCVVDQKELEQITKISKELGYKFAGQFALDCTRYIMQNKLKSKIPL